MSLKQGARLAKAAAVSIARTSQDRLRTAGGISDHSTKEKLRSVVSPPDVSRSLKKAGAALMMSPDPFTDVPAAALIGIGLAMSSRRPLSLESLVLETRRLSRDMQSLL